MPSSDDHFLESVLKGIFGCQHLGKMESLVCHMIITSCRFYVCVDFNFVPLCLLYLERFKKQRVLVEVSGRESFNMWLKVSFLDKMNLKRVIMSRAFLVAQR